MKTVLGIDPGTHTGWALCRERQILNSGVVSFAEQSANGYGAMFVAFRKFLADVQRDRGPLVAIAYELPFVRGPIATRILWGMAAHIQERCAAWHCRPLPVNTMALKKFATGTGKAKKPEMIAEAQRLLATAIGVPDLGEHEADAIHIARWGWDHLQ